MVGEGYAWVAAVVRRVVVGEGCVWGAAVARRAVAGAGAGYVWGAAVVGFVLGAEVRGSVLVEEVKARGMGSEEVGCRPGMHGTTNQRLTDG